MSCSSTWHWTSSFYADEPAVQRVDSACDTMSVDEDGRAPHQDPEALLRQIEAAERAEHRGQLKIFLGYASGVGKSFKLFDEGRRRHERGEDVVVAATQADSSPEVAQVLRSLEIIPTLNVEGV